MRLETQQTRQKYEKHCFFFAGDKQGNNKLRSLQPI